MQWLLHATRNVFTGHRVYTGLCNWRRETVTFQQPAVTQSDETRPTIKSYLEDDQFHYITITVSHIGICQQVIFTQNNDFPNVGSKAIAESNVNRYLIIGTIS